MSVFVLDASVAIKWVLPGPSEPLTAEALALLHRYQRAEIEFIVPDLFWVELGNALWKAARVGRCSAEQAEQGFELMRVRGLATLPSQRVLDEALSIAMTFGRTMYDSVYVALARQVRCELITADERLANALAARFPVKWLGAI